MTESHDIGPETKIPYTAVAEPCLRIVCFLAEQLLKDRELGFRESTGRAYSSPTNAQRNSRRNTKQF